MAIISMKYTHEQLFFLLMSLLCAVHVLLSNKLQACSKNWFVHDSGGSNVSQNKSPQLMLGYIYILKYLQSNFIG